MSPASAPRPWLTVPEFAAELQMAERTVRALCARGEIPGARRFGRAWRINRAEFETQPAAKPAAFVPLPIRGDVAGIAATSTERLVPIFPDAPWRDAAR